MEYIEIGKAVNTHGIKGEIKVYPYSNDFQNILSLKKIYIDEKEFLIQSIRVHKNMFVIKLENINSIEETSIYMNKLIYRKCDAKEDLDDNEFYVKDLIGVEVLLEDGSKFGTLKDVFQTGANDVYIVETEEHGEVLIPAIKSVVKDIDIPQKKMVIHLMEGLIW